MRVAYLGPPGTFSHEALLEREEHERWDLVAAVTVHAAVLAVQDGSADRALVPIENRLEGSVNATLDALALHAPDVVIAGEVVHPISHCLVTAGRVEVQEIDVVVSHPQASAQCAGVLRSELPGAAVLPAASTAEAVRQVVERGGEAPRWAAIGSRAAAALYGGSIIRSAIEDVSTNETRFAWLAPAGALPAGEADGGASAGTAPDATDGARWKTAIVWWGAGSGSPGWLVRCLSEFAFRGVNLTRIESRPRPDTDMGEYMFFADLDGRASDPPVADAVAHVRGHASTVRVLGSFPAASFPARGRLV